MAIDVTIDSILRNLGKNIKFNQPLFEAIVNSLEAHAEHISIEIFSDLAMGDLDPHMTGFTITDDGDGFTQRNRLAFTELWTDNKAALGCKGSGRFTWLSVYNSIHIESIVPEEKIVVCIPFNRSFTKDSIDIKPSVEHKKHTTITFSNVTDKYFSTKGEKKIDKRDLANPDLLKEDIIEYLLVKFFFLKRDNINFEIRIRTGNRESLITPDSIPDLENKVFSIDSDISHETYDFQLYYHFISDQSNSKKVYYCANNRSTQKIDDEILGFSSPLPNNDSFIMFVCSDYFNGKDDDTRNNLVELSHQKHASLLVPLLFSDINPIVKESISEIINFHYPEITEYNNVAIQKAKNEAPYLSSFFQQDTDIVKSTSSLLANARRKFAETKIQSQNRFETVLKEKKINTEEFSKEIQNISSIAAAELGEYVLYRNCIIKALQQSIGDTQYDESFIHNIFMPMKTNVFEQDAQKHMLSNLWLIDDKFMTYSFAASDISIQNIKKALGDNAGNFYGRLNRPDLSIFFNCASGNKDLIMVEFKGANADKNEKNKSLTELPLDIKIVRDNIPEVKSIWSYIITTIDDDFAQTIESLDQYTELFSKESKYRSYYSYNKKSNAHIYIIDLRSIIEDASLRNKTFLDILKSN